MDSTVAQLIYHQQPHEAATAAAATDASITNSTVASLLALTVGQIAQHILPHAELAIGATPSTLQPSTTTTTTQSQLAAVFGTALSAATANYTNDSGTTVNGTVLDVGPPLTPLQAIVVTLILSVVIVGTVIGNVLVCVAVCLVRKLRRPCNYLLVSLAVSDLCVAVLVMPTALLYEVLGKWSFGTVFCDVWVSFDVLSCTASILNLCAISVDRYWAITKPLEYGVKRTPRRMMMCVALVWLGAACISLPPLLIIGNEHETETGVPVCVVCQNFGYQIYATLGSFYIPLSVMLFVYYQIFRAARRIVMDEKRAQTRLEKAINGMAASTAAAATTTTLVVDAKTPEKLSAADIEKASSTTTTTTTENGGAAAAAAATVPQPVIGSPHQHKKLRFQLAKERKASTTLGIIMSAFTVCWLPFFILALIRPFLDTSHSTLTSLFLWLGYANSLLNPIIYATLNRDFRKPFQEILYFRCSSLNLMMREDFYHSQYGEPASQRVMLGGDGGHQGARESFL